MLGFALLAASFAPPFNRHRAPPAFSSKDDCNAGICGIGPRGPVFYPVAPDVHYYAEYDVPALPRVSSHEIKSTAYYIYFNIQFGNSKNGLMNQFVPQLMLGNPCCNSTNAPEFNPIFSCPTSSWIFSAQYFFEIKKNGKVEPHAATGEVFSADAGEKLHTTFEMDAQGIWILRIGVVGDHTRVSTVVVKQPYMGLLKEETTSFLESTYDRAGLNSCWELYIEKANQYPGSGSNMSMQTFRNDTAFTWETNWTEGGDPNCPGKPSCSLHQTDTPTHQAVEWDVFWPSAP